MWDEWRSEGIHVCCIRIHTSGGRRDSPYVVHVSIRGSLQGIRRWRLVGKEHAIEDGVGYVCTLGGWWS